MEINKLVVVGDTETGLCISVYMHMYIWGNVCVCEVYLQDGESVYNKTVHS